MTTPAPNQPGRTILVDLPIADTLFQRMIPARENERLMRAEQARRAEREAFVRSVERGRRRRAMLVALARNVAAVALLFAIGVILLAHFQ